MQEVDPPKLAHILSLRRQGEKDRIEFKRSLGFIARSAYDVEKTVASLANSAPYDNAFLLFGIDDNGKVVGLTPTAEEKRLFSKSIKPRRQQFSQFVSRIKPEVNYSWHEVLVRKKRIIIVQIKGRTGYSIFCQSDGKIHRRLDGHTYPAPREIVEAWRTRSTFLIQSNLLKSLGNWRKLSRRMYTKTFLDPAVEGPFTPSDVAVPLLTGEDYERVTIGELIDLQPRFWLKGPTGSGKSFMLKWLAYQTAQHARTTKNLAALYCDLRWFRGSLLDCIKDSCSGSNWPIGALIEEVISADNCLLLVDGLYRSSEQEEVLLELFRFLKDLPRLRVIISTRQIPTNPGIDERIWRTLDICEVMPLTSVQLQKFVAQFHTTKQQQKRIIKNLVLALDVRDRYFGRPDVKVGIGQSGNPLTIATAVKLYLEGSDRPSFDNLGELYSRTWGDLMLRRSTLRSKGRDSTMWMRLQKTALGIIASSMWKSGVPEPSIAEQVAIDALDKELKTGRSNYKDLRDELLDEFIGGGIITARAEMISFYHETIRDFFFAWYLYRVQGWSRIANSYHAEILMVFLVGSFPNPYKLLDFLYNRAKFNSYLANYLAIGLEHGSSLEDRIRNFKYLSMIFYYREDSMLGSKSLCTVLDFANEVGSRNIVALRTVFDLAGKKVRGLLRKLMASQWQGRWALVNYLPLLEKREMCRIIEKMFKAANSNHQRLRLLNLLIGQDDKLSHELLRKLGEMSSDAELKSLLRENIGTVVHGQV